MTELTRQEQIEHLQAEYDRRMANAQALKKQHDDLVIGLKRMDAEKVKEIEATLDSLPDATPKGIVDKVLQLPDEKRGQLIGNINKLKIAIANETRKGKEAIDAKQRLVHEIEQEQINDHTKDVFKKFYKFLELYNVPKDYFHNTLIPSIEEGYRLDPFFPSRGEKLGLSRAAMVSIGSHFKADSLHLQNMAETVAKIADLGDAYGERLLEKVPGSTTVHPFDNALFGFQESDSPPHRDPIND